jgi:hypothetical protein
VPGKPPEREPTQLSGWRNKGGQMTDNEKLILILLREFHTGEAKAIKSKDISQLTKLTDTGVRSAVRGLRKQGFPIGSSAKGFFYISNKNEFRKTVGHLTRRATDIYGTICLMDRSAAEKLFGQLSLQLEQG